MIVAFLGGSVKEYQAIYQQVLVELKFTCPICNNKCHSHGWYKPKLATVKKYYYQNIKAKMHELQPNT